MRTIILLVMINAQSIYVFSQTDWKWIAPNPPYKPVFSSDQAEGKAYFWCDDNTVIKLDIQTEKFEIFPPYASVENIGIGEFANQGIAFADSLVGYITASSYGEFRTTDGGKSWYRTSQPGSSINIVTFGSKQRGWKLGGGGFYITNNAGATWTFLGGPFFQSGVFSKMFALNQNQLWILTRAHYYGNKGTMWYSSNGGYNWSQVNTGLVSDSVNLVAYKDFRMNPSGVGFAVGYIFRTNTNFVEGFIQKTTDMGNTWTTTKFTDEYYKNVISIDDYDWIVFGNSASGNQNTFVHRKTSDMGGSWLLTLPLPEPYTNTNFYNAIYAPLNETIYTFTINGIFKSTDRGDSYIKITSETDVRVNQIVFDAKPKSEDEQMAIAWLKWNTKPYIISFDGGNTWQQKSLPQHMGYIWLVGIAEEVIYMIVNQTELYKSVDFGDTWQRLNMPAYGGSQALGVYSKDIFILKAARNLVSSTDGGTSWILGPTIDNIKLNENEIVNPGTIVGVGTYYDPPETRGLFYNTTDYGLSWHIRDTDKELYEVQMLNERIGYALGSNRLFKTSDTGNSWKAVLSNNNPYGAYSTFAFSDSLRGLVSEGYYCKRTFNGGTTWSTHNLRIPFRGISKMQFNARGDLFVIAEAMLIMYPKTQFDSPGEKKYNEDIFNAFTLNQNYPNPFNPSTVISYQLPVSGNVSLKVYDVLGNEVATLVDEYKEAGNYEVEFSAKGGSASGGNASSSSSFRLVPAGRSPDGLVRNLASGIYFYQLRAGDFIQTKKMILLK